MGRCTNLVSLIIITSILELCYGNFNFYIKRDEVNRLLGFSAELFYIREGEQENSALNFNLPVYSHLNYISFTWQSISGRALHYNILVTTSDNTALMKPYVNISETGEVPTREETFFIKLQCTGAVSADINVTTNLNIILNRSTNTFQTFSIKHIKSCRKNTSDNFVSDTLQTDTNSFNIIHIVVGCVCVLLTIIIIFVVSFYVESKQLVRLHETIQEPFRNSSCAGSNIGTNHPVTQNTFSTPVVPFPHNLFTENSTISTKSGNKFANFKMMPAYILTEEQSKDLQRRVMELSIQRQRIRLRNVILEGTFGRIYNGTYTEEKCGEENVLIKTVNDHASQNQISLLLQEGMAMYGLNHANILTILGVSIEDNMAPFLIYPYGGYTNLKRFLQKCKLCPEGVAHTLTTQEVVDMALQVVQGMQYLHSKMIIHKDLAARNCVIDTNLQVQITDNALSRDLFPADYHCLGDNENRPIKWLAIESLRYNLFLFQSDVWAFGVLLWEFLTLAQQPYLEIDPFEMEAYLRDGYRLAQPINCPDELFAVMAYCWAIRTEERPSFKQLQVCLQEFYTQLTKYV